MREQIALLFAEAYQKGIRTEPISCPDLTKEAISLVREEIKKELLTEEERQLVYIPCETCPIAIPTTGHAIPDFDIKECLDCAAKCHNQAQLQKILKALEE